MATRFVVKQMDVTRNERGEVLISIALPTASAMRAPVCEVWKDGSRVRAALRDGADAAQPVLALPDLPPAAARWIAQTPPHRPPQDQAVAIAGDTRAEGGRYALVAEVVDGGVANAYFARLASPSAKH